MTHEQHKILRANTIADAHGKSCRCCQEFNEVMGSETPSGLAWAQAWDDYKPFREYLTARGIDPASVVSAAVFTTWEPRQSMQDRCQLPSDS